MQDVSPERRLTRLDWVLAFALWLASLLGYLRTVAPDVLFGDSGEFQVLAVTGGLAHSTGYPVYLLLAKLFTFLPFGNEAFRVNLMSAVFAGIAVGTCFLTCRSIGVRRVFSGFAAIALAVQPLFWWQASIAEVYTTSTAVLGVILLCVLVWQTNRSPWLLALAGLLGGLSLGLHHLVLLTAPAFLPSVGLAHAKARDWRAAVVGIFVGLLLSASAYLWMGSLDSKATVTNSLKRSASAYGMEPAEFDNAATRIQFILLAKQWKGVLLSEDRKAPEVSKKYLDQISRGFTLIPVFLAAAGFLGLFATRRTLPSAILIVGSWVSMVAFVVTYRTFDIEVFFVPTLLMVAIGFGCGLQLIQGLVARLVPLRGDPRGLIPGLIGALAFGFLWPTLNGALEAVKEQKLTFLEGGARQIPLPVDQPMLPSLVAEELDSKVEDNALVVHVWQIIYPAYYISLIQKGRSRIEYIEATPTGTNGRLADSMQRYIDEQYGVRPVYIGRPTRELADRYDFVPLPGAAPLFKLVRK